MSINNWPKQEQPREKLLSLGAHALSEAELLAIFLRTGFPGQSAVDLARSLLTKFGNLNTLFSATLDDFTQTPGLGKAKYTQLQAVLELNRRFLQETLTQGNLLNSSVKTRNFLISKLGQRQREVFACLFLNHHYQLIKYQELFFGSLNQADIYPREIAKAALGYNASAIIIAHNHPTGSTQASEADINITKQLKHILSLLDIQLLDHFIIGINQINSLAEKGVL
jgi:DNA repair protein RadC